jgi:hypothetical protein
MGKWIVMFFSLIIGSMLLTYFKTYEIENSVERLLIWNAGFLAMISYQLNRLKK